MRTYWESAITLATGTTPGPLASAHPLTRYHAFQTGDGWMTIGTANQPNWLKLTDALQASAPKSEPGFATNDARIGNLPALVATLDPLSK